METKYSRAIALAACIFSISSLISGCGMLPRGLLYTDITEPLCVDARGTPLGRSSAVGNSKRIKIPTTQVDLSAEWDSRAIGDIAKRHNLSVVYSCDARRRSYVFGIWQSDEVIVYGE